MPIPYLPRMTQADRTRQLAALDHAHVWHPFTPMRQWREAEPVIIVRGEGPYLFDTRGNRYIDGYSSWWCNVHGHRVPAIDDAIRAQLDKVAHTTLGGLASPPSIELAARLAQLTGLPKVFYSDSGSTAVEIACKMAVGYWFHRGCPQKHRFISMRGNYHGDTTGSMSVGYSETFYKPFRPMLFDVDWFEPHDLAELRALLERGAERTAAIILEPVMQAAAGMIPQPPGFVRAVADLARQYDTLLIADEVATGFGRTGEMFACQHDRVTPDIMCLGKGITGGYLPLAATLCTDEIEQAFQGELAERKTLYHGHTYTGNALACAAALASLDLFEISNLKSPLLDHIRQSAVILAARLEPLRNPPHVRDIRHRGIMAGIEMAPIEPLAASRTPPATSNAASLCSAMRPKGLLLRPLGNVIVLMPIPVIPHDILHHMLDIVVETIFGLTLP